MLRPLTLHDMPALLDMAREMHRAGVYAEFPVDEHRIAYILTALIEAEDAFSMGCERSGELIGAFLGEVIQDLWVDVRVGVDHAFYVQEAHRGSIAGVAMLRAFERWAKEKGAAVIRPVVYAGINNEQGADLLSRLGYATAGTVHKKELC